MLTTITLAALLVAPTRPTSPTVGTVLADCSIHTNKGGCYTAGEYCRAGDLGKSTTTDAGEPIHCITESGRPHWRAG